MGSEDRALEARLKSLEQECRRLRTFGGLVLLAAASLPLMGQAAKGAGQQPKAGQKTIEAQHFVVRDDQGQIRANLGLNPNGGVSLGLIGQNKVFLGVNLDGAGFTIVDPAGRNRVYLTIKADQSVGLDLLSTTGKFRTRVELHGDDTPFVELNSAEGKARTSLVVLPNDMSGLLLTDGSGQQRVALANDPEGSTSLDFMDKLGKRRLGLGVKAEGAPSLSLFDEKGQVLERHPAGR